MKLTGSVVFLPVQNLEETRRFYTQVLGLELAMVQPGGAEIYDTGRGYWGFCQYATAARPWAGTRVCVSPSTARTGPRWTPAGGRPWSGAPNRLQPPALHSRFPVYSCFLADPDGYRVELQVIEME